MRTWHDENIQCFEIPCLLLHWIWLGGILQYLWFLNSKDISKLSWPTLPFSDFEYPPFSSNMLRQQCCPLEDVLTSSILWMPVWLALLLIILEYWCGVSFPGLTTFHLLIYHSRLPLPANAPPPPPLPQPLAEVSACMRTCARGHWKDLDLLCTVVILFLIGG